MSVTITLASLRQEMGISLGEGAVTGTMTATPSGTTMLDTNRFDPDGYWDGAFVQDVTASGHPINRVQFWTGGNNTFFMFQGWSGATLNDQYELHRLLSFPELRASINRAIAMCGQTIRNVVRDETQTLTAGTYQYTPNYDPSAAHAFFPGQVFRVEIEYETGLPTAPWIETSDWKYLDDQTIQLDLHTVDYYAGNPIRFSGYGPITTRLTSDDPTQTICTLPDEFAAEILIWACVHHAWQILAAKQTAGEQASSKENAQQALQQFSLAVRNWQRAQHIDRQAILPR